MFECARPQQHHPLDLLITHARQPRLPICACVHALAIRVIDDGSVVSDRNVADVVLEA